MSKNGISFFPLDVCLDTKFELIEAEYGLQGFAVVVKLFQRIYGEQGYYCDWTNEVALLFAHKIGLGGGVVSEIVNAAIKRGIFDKTLYEKYQILTSKGIQERYFEVVSRRKEVIVDSRFLLTSCCKNAKNVCKNEKNVDISSKNVDISKQSKVKESKVKNSKCETHTRNYDSGTVVVTEDYGRTNVHPHLTDFIKRNPRILWDANPPKDFDFVLLEKKIKESSFLGAQTLLSFFIKHYDKILADGYKDFHKPNEGVKQGNGFNQRSYREEELNELLNLGDLK